MTIAYQESLNFRIHLDEVLEQLVERIEWQESLPLEKPLVHIIDREADSAPHLRQLMGGKLVNKRKEKYLSKIWR